MFFERPHTARTYYYIPVGKLLHWMKNMRFERPPHTLRIKTRNATKITKDLNWVPVQPETLRTPYKGQGCAKQEVWSLESLLCSMGPRNHTEQTDCLQSKGVWTMQTRGFVYNLQGSVPSAGLAWNLGFWRQNTVHCGGPSPKWKLAKICHGILPCCSLKDSKGFSRLEPIAYGPLPRETKENW